MPNEKKSKPWRKALWLFSFILTGSLAKAQSSKQFADSARFFAGEKNNALALRYYLLAYEQLDKDSTGTESALRLNTETGDLLVATGQYAKAEPFYVTAKKLSADIHGTNSAIYASACNNLGWVYRLTGQLQKAEDHLIEAKNLREKLFGKDNADYATSCNRLAVLYADAGMYKEAEPLYFEAKDIREKVLGKNHLDYAMSCNNVAILYSLTGRAHKSEALYLEALRIREKLIGKENSLYAATCNNLGVLYLHMGLYSKAEPLYIEAREIRRRTLGAEHPEYAASCDNLAVLYMELGRFEKAEQLYAEARAIRNKVMGNKHPEFATGCNNLGLLYRMMGQYEKSASLLMEAREILGAVYGKEHPEYAKCCNNLGALYMDKGDWANATALYTEAKQIWEKTIGKEHPEYAKSCNNLALVSRYNGDHAKAEAYFSEALAIRAKSPGMEHPDYAQSCENLAVVYGEMGLSAKSLELHEKARLIREKTFGKEHPDYVQSCINIANLYRSTGNGEKAGYFFKEAFQLQQALTKKIFRFTTEKEQRAYVSKFSEYLDYFLSYSIPANGNADATYAYEVMLANKSLVLTSARQMRDALGQSKNPSLVSKYDEWIATREQLTGWYLKPTAERGERFAELEKQALTLEKELMTASAVFRESQKQKSWEDIRASLGKDEAAIEFASFRYYNGINWTDSNYYVAITLRPGNTKPEVTRLFEAGELERLTKIKGTSPGQHLVSKLYAALPGSNGNKNLYGLLWEPLEKKLAGVKTIYYSPAGDLHKVAFAAISSAPAERLVDRFKLIRLNSTGMVATNTTGKISQQDALALYGAVQYDADSTLMSQSVAKYKGKDLATRSLPGDLERHAGAFGYLQGSQKEIQTIAQLAEEKNFHVQLSTGVNASEESFKDLTGNASPAIVHIATHGFFFPDPKASVKAGTEMSGQVFRQSTDPLIRSGLALAGANNAWKGKSVPGIEDGILTSYEVSNMDLHQTKLAVLSACETGLGDIQGSEGVYGLQRAFKMAGVEFLLMSLWKVPDVETAEFMQVFYKNLFSVLNITDAFTQAQSSLQKKYSNDPFKWAAWVLIR